MSVIMCARNGVEIPRGGKKYQEYYRNITLCSYSTDVFALKRLLAELFFQKESNLRTYLFFFRGVGGTKTKTKTRYYWKFTGSTAT